MPGTWFGVFTLPSPWPPLHEVESFREDGKLVLTFDTRGRFRVHVKDDAQDRRRTFQVVDAPPGTKLLLTLRWDSSRLQGWINGTDLLEDSGDAPFVLSGPTSASRPAVIAGIPTGLSKENALFLESLHDLERVIVAPTRYELLRAAGILRQLFLDGNPLVHVVNRAHRLSLEFPTTKPSEPVVPGYRKHWQNPDSSLAAPTSIQIRSFDQFLAYPCLKLEGRTGTIADIIRANANVKGGVHLGTAKTPEDALILEWDQLFELMGEEASIHALVGIVRAALDGLRPLVAQITGEQRR